jgi:diaminopimelate epimerase
MKFIKYHGCGNDYVYVDCFKEHIENPSELAIKVSGRRKGIGSDGLILICPSNCANAKMRIFNADGSEANMCGNGIRCVGKYLFDERGADIDISVETPSGIRNIEILRFSYEKSLVRVNMGTPLLLAKNIPFLGTKADEKIINYEFLEHHITCVSIGNPHCVIFVNEIEKTDVAEIGERIQNSAEFPEGVNVEFVQIISEDEIRMRVWERGSGETFACGTGACASVVACILGGFCAKDSDVKVMLLGGELEINYTGDSIFMTGEAVKVFEGEIFFNEV